MPLHHQIPPTHVHRLPGIPPPPAATNGSATPPSRMPVHHHHGIHLPPPTVMLSMPPPSVTMQQGGVVTTQAPPIPTMQQNMHIQPYIHHHSTVNRNVNGNGEVHLQQHHYNKRQQQQQHNTTKNNIKNFNSSKPMVGKKPLGKHPPDKAAKLPIPLLGSKAKGQQPHQGYNAKPLMTSTLPPPQQQPQKSTQPEPKKTNFEAVTIPNEVEDHSNPSKVKTPMCLINELARYNKIQQQYRLTDESGPAHKKTFTVCLKLGDCEEYIASGPSIKKAQHAAAAIAMEKTQLKHPPPKSRLVKNTNVTPTVELNALAMKRGEPTVYTFTDTIRPQGQMTASGTTASINFRGMYNQRYHQQGQKGNAGSSGTTTSTTAPLFRVKLSVGPLEVTGEGSTAQAAKHAAATNALLKIKESPLPNRTTNQSGQSGSGSISIKSNLNPASVPFIPSSAKSPSKAASTASAASASLVTSSGTSVTVTSTVTSMTSSMTSSTSAVSPATSSKAESEADSTTSKDTNFSELKSPISLVHENALKRNLTVKFEVVRETGPPHMRTFLTRCIVGEFVTEGEGNGKKSSKTEAALLMIEKLKDLPPVASCQKVPKKKSTSAAAAAAAKKKSKNLIKLEQKANPDYGQSINPISRLIQIQQAKKQKEPVYTLIAERGMPRRREFVMEVSAAGANAQGSGPNKKLAKRSAAESLLQIMGYSRPSLQPAKPALKNTNSNGSTASSSTSSTMSTSSITNGELKTTHSTNSLASKDKTKKLTFVDQVKAGENCRNNGNNEKNNVVPGLLYLDTNTKKDDALRLLQAENGVLTNGFSQAESEGKAEAEEDDAKILEPKEELQYLSEVLGFGVTFTDFPQKSTSSKTKSSSSQQHSSSPPEFITLVKLSTKPPKVCHGQGSTRDASQTDAARRALVLLADSGALNDEDKSSPAENNLFNGNGNNDSIPIVSAATATAPPSENDNTCA